MYIPVLCVQDWFNGYYKFYFNAEWDTVHIMKPALPYCQANSENYIQDSESDPFHKCDKIREQHGIVSATIGDNGNNKLN
jgi:hypothetical protein